MASTRPCGGEPVPRREPGPPAGVSGIGQRQSSRPPHDPHGPPDRGQYSRDGQPDASVADQRGTCEGRQRRERKEVDQLEILDEETAHLEPAQAPPAPWPAMAAGSTISSKRVSLTSPDLSAAPFREVPSCWP